MIVQRSLFVLLVAAGCRTATPPEPPSEGLDGLLPVLGLERRDVAIRGGYLLDPDRLSVNRRILLAPLEAERESERVRLALSPDPLSGALILAREWLTDDRVKPRPHDAPDLRAQVDAASDRVRALRASLIDLVRPEQTLIQPQIDALLKAGRSVDRGRLLDEADSLVSACLALTLTGADASSFAREGVVVGTVGRDTFRSSATLIVDPGGDDVYLDVGRSFPRLPVVVIVDLAGDDTYEGAVGVADGGVSLAFDMSGDDRYTAAEASQGSGIGGVGLLFDAAGSDTYRAGVGSQGFGLYGVGCLIDLAGDDVYESDLLSQGAAGPGGVGILYEGGGEDHYRAGGRFPDPREAGRYFRSMSQGFALGLRYDASGGVGVLFDRGGSDRYRVEYFGQGAAHWGGTGFLIDEEGDDVYRARRYAQGCGTHIAAGLIVDARGDDLYSMHAVGQGCGHDLAVGVLHEGAGSDRYQGGHLTQGVGNANGIGVLADRAGDDEYAATSEGAQGYGSSHRGYGSIGVVIDGGGDDRYSGNTAGNEKVWVSGDLGGGVDR